MNPKKRQAIIFTIFALAVIWGIYDFIGNKRVLVPDSPEPTANSQASPKMSPDTIDVKKYSILEWGKDPFYRGNGAAISVSPDPDEPDWILAGILFDPHKPAAVINKKIVCAGDNIDGARVVRIERKIVILDKNGLRFTLTLAKEKS